jgi:hypothetical protein
VRLEKKSIVKLKPKTEKMMKTKTLMKSAALVGALMACSAVVNANPMLELISGSSSTLVTAGSAVGSISYSGTIGQWSVDFASGENVLGGPSLPQIDLSSQETAAKGTFTPPLLSLTIEYTSGGNFGSGPVLGTIGGTTTTSVSDWQYLGSTAFSTQQLLTALGPFTSKNGKNYAFSGTAFGNTGAIEGSYWLTEEVVISGSRTSAGQGTSFDANSQVVPDGATTMTLLGSAIAGLGMLRSRFGKRA